MNTLLKINMVENLDSLQINFDTEGLWVLNITLAIIMFGVALGITLEDFKRLFQNPKILFTLMCFQSMRFLHKA